MTVDENVVQLQLYARAPAPSRDYYGLTITQTKIILNIWNISYGPHVYPKRQVATLDDFIDHKYMQNDVQKVFGDHALDFALRFAAKERNLQYIPMKIFLRILRFLATNDILRLSQTSKIFFDMCNSEAVWKIIYRKRIKRRMMLGDLEKGTEMGWKQALKTKIIGRVTLRNLLDKNETKVTPVIAQNQLNNAVTPISPAFTVTSLPSKSNISGNDYSTSVVNKSSISIIRNIKDTPPPVDRRRLTKSAITAQASSSLIMKVDRRPHNNSAHVQKNETPQKELKLPINRSKLYQCGLAGRPSTTGSKLMKEIDILRKTITMQPKVEKTPIKYGATSSKNTNKNTNKVLNSKK